MFERLHENIIFICENINFQKVNQIMYYLICLLIQDVIKDKIITSDRTFDFDFILLFHYNDIFSQLNKIYDIM